MSDVAVFPPDNQTSSQGIELTDQLDAATWEILERKRKEVLQVTNYLEALYARILAQAAGATALSVIADETSSSPVQTA